MAVDTFTSRYGLRKIAFDQNPWHDKLNTNFDRLDALIFSSSGMPTVDGTWANETEYEVGDRIFDEDTNELYSCLIAHESDDEGTFEDDRTANPTYWAQVSPGIVLRGGWVTATAYRTQDIVTYDGNSYECIVNHTSGTFATDLAALNWRVFVEKGSAGAGTGDVVGPASSVDGRVPVFSGTSGKLLADGGTLLSALAPKASPTFTGTVTIPTVGGTSDDTTKAASTAFVQAVVAAAINALKNGVDAAYDTLAEIATALAGKLSAASNLGDVGSAASAFANIKQAATESATGVVEIATVAEIRAGTDTGRVITPGNLIAALAEVTLTDAATITVDGATFINATVTLGGNRTFGTFANAATLVGRVGRIKFKQDATGSRTITFHADYEFAGASAPTLSTAANAEDLFDYEVLASGRIAMTLAGKAFS